MFISLPCLRKETLFPLFSYPDSFRFLLWYYTVHRQPCQWRIKGGGPPLFFDQTEARRVEKNVFETAPPPYLKVWIPPPSLSEGLDLPLLLTLL